MTVIFLTEHNTKCYGVTFKKMIVLNYKYLRLSQMMKILH